MLLHKVNTPSKKCIWSKCGKRKLINFSLCKKIVYLVITRENLLSLNCEQFIFKKKVTVFSFRSIDLTLDDLPVGREEVRMLCLLNVTVSVHNHRLSNQWVVFLYWIYKAARHRPELTMVSHSYVLYIPANTTSYVSICMNNYVCLISAGGEQACPSAGHFAFTCTDKWSSSVIDFLQSHCTITGRCLGGVQDQ